MVLYSKAQDRLKLTPNPCHLPMYHSSQPVYLSIVDTPSCRFCPPGFMVPACPCLALVILEASADSCSRPFFLSPEIFACQFHCCVCFPFLGPRNRDGQITTQEGGLEWSTHQGMCVNYRGFVRYPIDDASLLRAYSKCMAGIFQSSSPALRPPLYSKNACTLVPFLYSPSAPLLSRSFLTFRLCHDLTVCM